MLGKLFQNPIYPQREENLILVFEEFIPHPAVHGYTEYHVREGDLLCCIHQWLRKI